MTTRNNQKDFERLRGRGEERAVAQRIRRMGALDPVGDGGVVDAVGTRVLRNGNRSAKLYGDEMWRFGGKSKTGGGA
jgi:hypothetical protein